MKKLIAVTVVSSALLFTTASLAAMESGSVMVGGAAMFPQKKYC